MQAEREKVLIIKPGYSETLDPENSGIVSLGDIVRTTPILHLFPREAYHVTWLVDTAGAPLLRGNDMIDRVLSINAFTPFHLTSEYFDIVVNLEKDPGICAMADQISAWRRYGFRFNPREGVISSYEHGQEAMRIVADPQIKRDMRRPWVEVLYEMLGTEHSGQSYVLGYKAENVKPTFDIGLNYRAGPKFPLKVWPQELWKEIEERLSPDFSISWQPATDNIEKIETYFDWIAGCRMILTHDSLGLHLAMGLNRSLVGLFGPTNAYEIHDTPGVVKLMPENDNACLGCRGTICKRKTQCISTISVDRVEAAIRQVLEDAPA